MTQTELTKQKYLFGITVTIEKNIDIHPSVPTLKKTYLWHRFFKHHKYSIGRLLKNKTIFYKCRLYWTF